MRAIRAPRRRLAWCSSEHQHQPPLAGDRSDTFEQRAPLTRRIMTEDHPAVAR